jgi:DNA-binding MarR family transcriptional regulator
MTTTAAHMSRPQTTASPRMPHSPDDLAPEAAAGLALRTRTELLARPVGDFSTTIAIVERMEKLRFFGDCLQRGLETMTSLRTSHYLILRAVEEGVRHARHIGRRVGMDTGAVEVTLDALRDRGLVVTLDDASREVALTDSGVAVLAQAEAVELRATDALLQQGEPEDVAEMLDLLDRAVGHAESLTLRFRDDDAQSA